MERSPIQPTRRDVIAGAGAIGLATALPAQAQAPAAPGDAAATAMLADLAEGLLVDFPENALIAGIDTGARAALRGRFADRSQRADKARAARAVDTLARLRAIDRDRLSRGVALDLDTAEAAWALAVEGGQVMPVGDVAILNLNLGYRNTPYVVSQLAGAYLDLPDLLENKHAVGDMADADAYLARVDAYAAALDGETGRVLVDGTKGAILPGFLIDITIGQLKGMRATPPGGWTIVTGLAAKCARAGLPPRIAEQAATLCAERIVPALDRQIAALARQRAQADDSPGIWARPGGEDWYRWLVKAGTTTAFSPDEIHAQGLEQSAKLNAEIDALLKGQGLSQGSVGARLTALSKRPDLLFADDDAGRARLLTYLNGRIADIRTRMPRAFGKLVRANLRIQRVPPEIQDGMPNGYAMDGSHDGTLPGIYYINLKTNTIWPRYALPTLCYHEGIPGHIWQADYTHDLPLIRNLLGFNAYAEGWALYAEQLGDELGAYDGDPLGRIGYLQSMNFRAARLVVDTGLHAKRWSFAQAQTWMQGATGLPMAQVTSELQRYCAMPGQACGYKMGHNQINLLRLKAQVELGRRFDVKAFNDVVVQTGSVPLTLLGRVVDRYIASV